LHFLTLFYLIRFYKDFHVFGVADYVKICNNEKVQKINDFMRLYHLKTIDGTIVDENNKQQILESISETQPFEGFIKNVFIYKFGSKKYNL